MKESEYKPTRSCIEVIYSKMGPVKLLSFRDLSLNKVINQLIDGNGIKCSNWKNNWATEAKWQNGEGTIG